MADADPVSRLLEAVDEALAGDFIHRLAAPRIADCAAAVREARERETVLSDDEIDNLADSWLTFVNGTYRLLPTDVRTMLRAVERAVLARERGEA